MLPILYKTPLRQIQELGNRAKMLRLKHKFTRKTLSLMSGVPESTIKRFENTGHIGTEALLMIATSLNASADFSKIFHFEDNYIVIPVKKRKRGSQ